MNTMSTSASPRKRLLVPLAVLAIGVTAFSVAATQYVAMRTGYAGGLGSPVATIRGLPVYTPWKWVEWAQAPWAEGAFQTFARIKVAGLLMIVVPTTLLIIRRTGRSRRPRAHPEIHGTARFATDREIVDAGLAAGTGVHLGGWRDRRGRLRKLRHDGPEHVAIIAPTRSGKGVGVIVPSLLTWSGSTVVYDEKGELWSLTAGWRHALGHSVLRFEPGAPGGCARFNFLDAVRVGTPNAPGDAQNIALLLVDHDGRGVSGDHWKATAYQLLAGLILFVRAKKPNASLADVAYALSEPGRDPDAVFDDMAAGRDPFVAQVGQAMLSRHPRERSSVQSTASIAVELFLDPIVARNTAASDFRLPDVMNGDGAVALYIVTPGPDRLRLRPLVRLLLATMMRTLMSVPISFAGGRPLPPRRHRLLLVLDEFPSLGRLDVIEDALPKCAGYGIRVLLAAQDRDQVVAAYGRHESILANCHLRIAYAPNSAETAEWVSQLCGEGTVVREVLSESGSRFGPLKSVARSLQESRRRLLTADEVMRLRTSTAEQPGELLLFAGGLHPIRGEQTPYWRDGELSMRAGVELAG